MFSDIAIAVALGGGIGFWLYGKFLRSTGNNTKNAALGALISGIIIIIVVTIVLQIVFKHLKT